MYTESTLIIETLIALLFSAFFSGMEIAFVSSSKLRFEMEREQRGFTSRLIDTFYQHPNSFISTLLVGNNIALVIYGILMARLINAYILIPLGIHQELGDCPNEVICLLIQTILSTLIVLVTGEFLPKTLFKLNPKTDTEHPDAAANKVPFIFRKNILAILQKFFVDAVKHIAVHNRWECCNKPGTVGYIIQFK